MVKEINNVQEFFHAIGNEQTGMVIIDFYADWCGPCKMIAPKFNKLAEKYPNIDFYKVNSDKKDTSEIARACEVSSLPSFCLFKGGKYITKTVGANETNIENMILSNTVRPKQ